mgnify:CR=1 FL=1
MIRVYTDGSYKPTLNQGGYSSVITEDGKVIKILYQGFKNTHNRFGVIDFEKLKNDIKNELNYEVDIESTKTVKGISEELQKIGLVEDLYKMIEKKANEQIKNWFPTLDVEAIILEEKEVSGW